MELGGDGVGEGEEVVDEAQLAHLHTYTSLSNIPQIVE